MKNYTVPISLAGAALIVAGGLAMLLESDSGPLPKVNMGLGIGLLVFSGVLNPDLFRQYGRWINAFWGTILVLGIVVLVNFLSERYHERFDMTAGRLHSLANLTQQTLESMARDVKVLAFMEEGSNDELETLLKTYTTYSSRFDYEMIDPDKEPERTQEYGVKQYNTLVVEADGNRQRITALEEKEITSALIKVLRDRREKIYLTTGHGEAHLGDEPGALGVLKARLRDFDYAITDSLFLGHTGHVPEDCAVLMIAGPQLRFLQPEIDAIHRYLERGGSLLVLLDPLNDSGLDGLLREWGVAIGEDFVIDTSGIGSLFGLDMTTPVASSYGDHPITQKHDGVLTFFQLARSVELEEKPGIDATVLIATSKQGWAESDLGVLGRKGQRKVELNEDQDRLGPISLAVAGLRSRPDGTPAGRLAVFGDSDFASNQFFDFQGNGDLVLNTLSWLAEDESLISIRPKEAGHNPIALTQSQSDWIFWISVVLWPAAVSLIGIAIVSSKGSWSLADLLAAGLGVAVVLLIVGVINYLGESYNKRVDVTAEKLFTLSDDTKGLLEPLEQDNHFISVKSFMSELESPRLRDLLEEYSHLSGNFEFEMMDPKKHAVELKQYAVKEQGTSIIEADVGGEVRTERITAQTEEALSNAIQRAIKAEVRQIYFTGGHGEGDLGLVDGNGFSMLKGRLEEMNYGVSGDLVLNQGGIPEDAELLVVLAPKEPFTNEDREEIQRHLSRGKKALFLLDPGLRTGLERTFIHYQVQLGQNFVVDASGIGQLFGADVSSPVVVQYGDHAITQAIPRGGMSFFPLARSVMRMPSLRPTAVAAETQVVSLLMTHKSSWGETNLDPIFGREAKVEFDRGTDARGPLSLGVAVEAQPDSLVDAGIKTRFVLFGDSDFVRNQFFGQQVNGELIVSSIKWLTESRDKLSIPIKEPANTPVYLTYTNAPAVIWGSVFVLPLAVALSGMIIVLRRGYETYYEGLTIWLTFNFGAAAVFFFVLGVIGASAGEVLSGEGYLLAALLSAGVAVGLFRRAEWAWMPALVLCVFNVGIGFVAIPQETIQLVFAGLFVVNGALLVWIKRTFLQG